MATLYWQGAVDDNYHTLGNWWTDFDCTVPAGALPTPADDVVIQPPSWPDRVYDCLVLNSPVTVRTLTVNGTFVAGGPRDNPSSHTYWLPDEYGMSVTATVSITVNYWLVGTYSSPSTRITAPVAYMTSPGASIFGSIAANVVTNGCGPVVNSYGGAQMICDVYGNVTASGSDGLFFGFYLVNGNINLSGDAELTGGFGAYNIYLSGNATMSGTPANGVVGEMLFEGNSKATRTANSFYNENQIFWNATFNDQSGIEVPTAENRSPYALAYGYIVFNGDSYVDSRYFYDPAAPYYAGPPNQFFPPGFTNALYFNGNSTNRSSSTDGLQSYTPTTAINTLAYNTGGSVYNFNLVEIRYEKGINQSSILGII